MIKTLVVEDRIYTRKSLIASIESLDREICIVGECGSVKKATSLARINNPDLVFLDINLSDGNAFDFLEQTKELNFQIIFITAYEEYALKALKSGAIDYILKPVDVEELEVAVDKVVDNKSYLQEDQIKRLQLQLSGGGNKLVLSLQDTLQVVDLNELMYCKSDKGYTTFYLDNGKKYMVSKTLKYFKDQLPDYMFIRAHQSFFVNINFIDRYDKEGYTVLKGGQKIPVSSRKQESFIAKLLNR